MIDKKPYIETIIEISRTYLEEAFPNKERLDEFLHKIDFLKTETNIKEIINKFTGIYIDFVKKDYQNQYIGINKSLRFFRK
ncbi:MAG TPA: hypothetical protein PK762_03885 [Candidatus Kapabacteria bacterium]|nr:hypothetical protein [Candidatus Kapabacteria bacterium]